MKQQRLGIGRNEGIFLEMNDEAVDQLFITLGNRTIDRDDYNRLARWLSGMVRVLAGVNDSTLDVLVSITSKSVTFTQRMLIKEAIRRNSGLLLSCVVDGSAAACYIEAVLDSPARQEGLPL